MEVFDVKLGMRVARFTALGEVEASIVVQETDGPVRTLSIQDALPLW